MLAVEGLLDPEAGATLLAALDPLTLPSGPTDSRTGAQRRADALTELARRALEGGRLPERGGVRPQVTVTVDLASLLGQPGRAPGVLGGAGEPLAAEAARRLACDAAVTRVVTTGHPTGHHHPTSNHDDPAAGGPHAATTDHDELTGRLRHALALLPPVLGGARPQILDVGRTTRVTPPALRTALAVRDGGCVVAGCQRPPAWCDAHHVRHWLHGGPTSLDNLVLVCRAHHRAVHEGHQHLARGPTGQHTLTHSPAQPKRRLT